MIKKIFRNLPVTGLLYYITKGERKDAAKGVDFIQRKKRMVRQFAITGAAVVLGVGYACVAEYAGTYRPDKIVDAAIRRYEYNYSNNLQPTDQKAKTGSKLESLTNTNSVDIK